VSLPFPVTTSDKLACAIRELAMRKTVYPRLIEKGQIRADNAEREIAIMKAIVEDYAAQLRREDP
jgi:hypothetical protein